MKRFCVLAILLLSFCGLADAMYLTEHALSGAPVICNVAGLSDCNTVAESSYSRIFGVPVAAFGVFFYAMLFILSAIELLLRDAFLRRVLQVGAIFGVLASLYFTFLQIFVIQAFCVYCLASALASFLIGIAAWYIEPSAKRSVGYASRTGKTIPMPPVA